MDSWAAAFRAAMLRARQPAKPAHCLRAFPETPLTLERSTTMSLPTDVRRRQLLAGSASALVAVPLAGCATAGGSPTVAAPAAAPAAPAAATGPKPLPAYAAWKDADSLIVHSSSTIETKRSAMGASLITPSERLYVRNN